MRVLLLSTYELGHQPLHLASPAGALRRAGHEVRCADLAVGPMQSADVDWCELVGISVPMHTAARLAQAVTADLRARRDALPVCFYGLYAAVDDGAGHDGEPDVRIAGEYEAELVALADSLAAGGTTGAEVVRVRVGRQHLGVPARDLLAPLGRYAQLMVGGETRLAGYVEASRGCVHRCRHCPVPVVYDGRTRVVDVDTVVADVAQLVEGGARHVSFGDPDFLSGPAHARRVVAAVHHHFPSLTFDVTVKVSHILAQSRMWPQMAESGCLFVVSAFESASDVVLDKLDKGHTAADEVEAVAVVRQAGIEPRPSFLPFTPWTTADDVRALVDLVEHCQLVGNVDPVQWSIRLLVPPGSLLLESGALDGLLGPYDPRQLGFTWRAPDARLDLLQERLAALADEAAVAGWGAPAAHLEVRRCVEEVLGSWETPMSVSSDPRLVSRMAPDDRPRLSEPWFCCAEPTDRHWRLAVGAGSPA